MTAHLSTEAMFASGSPNQVLAPNKVVELKSSSVVVEKPFEGSTEIPFFVRLASYIELSRSDAFWHSARCSPYPCVQFPAPPRPDTVLS